MHDRLPVAAKGRGVAWRSIASRSGGTKGAGLARFRAAGLGSGSWSVVNAASAGAIAAKHWRVPRRWQEVPGRARGLTTACAPYTAG